MKISRVIQELEAVREEHGEIEVVLQSNPQESMQSCRSYETIWLIKLTCRGIMYYIQHYNVRPEKYKRSLCSIYVLLARKRMRGVAGLLSVHNMQTGPQAILKPAAFLV